MKSKKLLAIIIILAIILPAVLYYAIIPRLDITYRIAYSESFLGNIFVDLKVINDGTVEAKNIEIEVTVLNDEDKICAHKVYNIGILESYCENNMDSFRFRGSHLTPYALLIKVTLHSMGKSYEKVSTFNVREPYMTQMFEDKIQDVLV